MPRKGTFDTVTIPELKGESGGVSITLLEVPFLPRLAAKSSPSNRSGRMVQSSTETSPCS